MRKRKQRDRGESGGGGGGGGGRERERERGAGGMVLYAEAMILSKTQGLLISLLSYCPKHMHGSTEMLFHSN